MDKIAAGSVFKGLFVFPLSSVRIYPKKIPDTGNKASLDRCG